MHKLNFKNRVYDKLLVASPFAARLFERTFHHPIRTQQPSDRILINDLNQYWRLQLGSLTINTIDARSALIDTDDFEQWFELFNQYTLPVVIGPWANAHKGDR